MIKSIKDYIDHKLYSLALFYVCLRSKYHADLEVFLESSIDLSFVINQTIGIPQVLKFKWVEDPNASSHAEVMADLITAHNPLLGALEKHGALRNISVGVDKSSTSN